MKTGDEKDERDDFMERDDDDMDEYEEAIQMEINE